MAASIDQDERRVGGSPVIEMRDIDLGRGADIVASSQPRGQDTNEQHRNESITTYSSQLLPVAHPNESTTLLSDQQSPVDAAPTATNRSEDPSHSESPTAFEHLPATQPTLWGIVADIWKWWYAEILGCVFALVCLIAQIVVLSFYNGKPQESWNIKVITINGLIALLSTFCRRSALMVTIAATLAQSKWNHLGGAHKSGKTASLDNIAVFDAASRGVMGSLHVLLKFKGVHIACAGGVLTIATMGLGLFSQQLISIRIDAIEVAAPGNIPRAVEVAANGTLPLEGDSLSSFSEVNYFSTRGGGSQVTGLPKFPIPASANESARILWLGQILAIGYDYNLTAEEIIDVLPAIRAYHCGLWYCIQARNISVNQGIITDTVSETWNDVVGASAMGLPPSFNADPSETFHITGSTGIPAMSSQLNGAFRDGKRLSVPTFSTSGLSFPLYGLIIHKHFHQMDDLINKIARSFTNDVRTNPTPFEKSFPAYQYNPRFDGTMTSTQLTLVIRWQWLAFPASMVLLTTIYLALEISRTRGIRDVHPWKEDALVPLYIELDHTMGDRARAGLNTPGGIRKRIGEVPVKYENGTSRARIVPGS
ncbi:hypothetical protein F5X68DRAFT_247899 [Plectosphaerella plurivora]|uniref:Uncharacterized protein n=1 Tax=Plectosphaerella plurivora TaxID=936078 RepID=A0A9P8VKK2_9PEZI|nr:hypothetical protein F5X68DRAFT_247899 [Plectosphaerella plurivora]